MYIIVANFLAKPEHREAFLKTCLEDAASSLKAEPGCKRFEVYSGHEEPERIVLFEVYDDEAAFQAHMKTPHFAKFAAETRGKSAEGPQLLRLANVSPIDAFWKK